jgi:hypothetical protein
VFEVMLNRPGVNRSLEGHHHVIVARATRTFAG